MCQNSINSKWVKREREKEIKKKIKEKSGSDYRNNITISKKKLQLSLLYLHCPLCWEIVPDLTITAMTIPKFWQKGMVIKEK